MTIPVEQPPTRTTGPADSSRLGSVDIEDPAAAVLPRVVAPRSRRGHVRTHAVVGLTVDVSYPRRDLVLIALAGELDMCTVDRLREVLAPRLEAVVETVVLDLSQVNFLAVVGLDLLQNSRVRAEASGIDLRVVIASRAVARPMAVAGLDRLLACYSTVAAAVDLAGD